ncbi:DUF5129 domain-containing protein [Corynebacterium flavescens]|uniref:DUF5129 domain-containing protein n=3 Tax=Corynebacterium flavescens TaxID=28028 RepID=UPI0023F3AC93|nr:DUF5129 domain-containing protein [Corynebacterium flavescens]MDN6601792.1 DUF5129 domain-containing protein [Corynebacterium flavescens]MDN6824083.1 DUF5129 domain-containing protein [Corynebacterium flavescens]
MSAKKKPKKVPKKAVAKKKSEAEKPQALTEAELKEISHQARPSIGKMMGVSLILGAIGGGALVGGVGAAMDVPQRADYEISNSADTQITNTFSTQIDNPDGVLSEDDEARMERDVERLEVPAVVKQLNYIVFADNDDNVNDTVENYLRDNHPELIGDDKFADGVLIVGVGLDPRQAFIFAGEDVADTLDLRDSSHLDDSLDAIKPGVEDNNIPAGLFAGADEATDVSQLAEDRYNDAVGDRIGAMAGAGIGGGGAIFGIGMGVGAYRRNKAKKVAQARAEMSLVGKEYGELATRLDQIDIRAHSLASPFANETMRKQWEEVRDRFFNIHGQVDALGNLTSKAPDEKYLEQADAIHQAAVTTREVSYAEENIDKLYSLEHGDELVRRTELQALRDDVVEAQVSLDDAESGLYRELQNLRERADSMMAKPQHPGFLDDYVLLLGDYRTALEQLRQQKFDDLEEAKNTALVAPGITSPDYRVGYGYNNFVPFWALSTWHSSNASAQSSSGSSANTSFSSGFSGSGGSSSF